MCRASLNTLFEQIQRYSLYYGSAAEFQNNFVVSRITEQAVTVKVATVLVNLYMEHLANAIPCVTIIKRHCDVYL